MIFLVDKFIDLSGVAYGNPKKNNKSNVENKMPEKETITKFLLLIIISLLFLHKLYRSLFLLPTVLALIVINPIVLIIFTIYATIHLSGIQTAIGGAPAATIFIWLLSGYVRYYSFKYLGPEGKGKLINPVLIYLN